MDSKIVLGRILQRFIDLGYAQVVGYNRFGFIELKKFSVIVSREDGADTLIPFSRMVIAIEAYQKDETLYMQGTSALRGVGITHITSPVFAMLHLLDQEDYS